MLGYIYLTTNTLNNMSYIGKHHAQKFEPEKYLGSNKHLLASIKKYGRENFTCRLLQVCFSDDDLNNAEKYWIDLYGAVESSMFYNIASGGEGGRVMLNRVWVNNGTLEKRILKDEPIPEGFVLGGLRRNNGHKVSAAKKGKPSKNKGKRWFNNGTDQTMANKCPEGWKPGRLKFALSGKELYNNGKEHKYFTHLSEIPAGWVKGAIPGSRTSNTSGKVAYNNGVTHIYLHEDEIPPEGFIRGYTKERNIKNQESHAKPSKGKHWYNNGIEQRYFSETDIVPDGWKLGCCKLRTYKKSGTGEIKNDKKEN